MMETTHDEAELMTAEIHGQQVSLPHLPHPGLALPRLPVKPFTNTSPSGYTGEKSLAEKKMRKPIITFIGGDRFVKNFR
jgi:hypothetical protein